MRETHTTLLQGEASVGVFGRHAGQQRVWGRGVWLRWEVGVTRGTCHAMWEFVVLGCVHRVQRTNAGGRTDRCWGVGRLVLYALCLRGGVCCCSGSF